MLTYLIFLIQLHDEHSNLNNPVVEQASKVLILLVLSIIFAYIFHININMFVMLLYVCFIAG
ncbi:hypothetical protein HanXRQr2_Chr17g0822221 [Helianthus annuus]|uniref:Uncharacterized protein n=1 Tax=Helianthus annuus TaxID=4232 RepID=A0A9K3GV95_HELAN|nr:hypothetical protein HanXRQr2_Chr17g0822221 [Helianthus annuus]